MSKSIGARRHKKNNNEHPRQKKSAHIHGTLTDVHAHTLYTARSSKQRRKVGPERVLGGRHVESSLVWANPNDRQDTKYYDSPFGLVSSGLAAQQTNNPLRPRFFQIEIARSI